MRLGGVEVVVVGVGRGNNGSTGGRGWGGRTVQKVKERKVKRRRQRDMTGRYEALKGALVAPVTTLLWGREEEGVGGEESAVRSLARWPAGAPHPPLRPFS